MDIEKLTVGEARQIAALFSAQLKAQDDSHWEIGKPYFLRTVTHHHQGRLVKVTPQELVLEDAAWVPDDGRFARAVATSAFAEVEPFPAGKQVIIGRGSLVDAVRIDALNLTQK